MPTYTGAALITSALRFAHIIDPVDAPDQEHFKVGEELATDLLDSWRNDKFLVPATTRVVKALTGNTASYTIGPGGNINTVWPPRIPMWGLILDNTASTLVERPMGRTLTDAEYANTRIKARTGSPTSLWYDRQHVAGLGRVYPIPYPAATGQSLVLYCDLGDLTAIDKDDDYNLRPGFALALKRCLGLELAEFYNFPITDRMTTRAAEALAKVKRVNTRPQAVGPRRDFAMLGQRTTRGRFRLRSGG